MYKQENTGNKCKISNTQFIKLFYKSMVLFFQLSHFSLISFKYWTNESSRILPMFNLKHEIFLKTVNHIYLTLGIRVMPSHSKKCFEDITQKFKIFQICVCCRKNTLTLRFSITFHAVDHVLNFNIVIKV